MQNVPNYNGVSFKGNYLSPYNQVKDFAIRHLITSETDKYDTSSSDIMQKTDENAVVDDKRDKEYEAIIAKYGTNIQKYNAYMDVASEIAKNTPPEQIMAKINTGRYEYIDNTFQDIEFADVDLSQYTKAFKRINFNEKTFAKVSPKHLPEGFNPQEILEKGKTIGLGIDKVHNMGYTGEGVSYAIIDTGTLDASGKQHNDIHFKEYNVSQYADKLGIDHFHGRATSYIAQEIAPKANCYYYATHTGENMDAPVLDNLKSILEKNKSLPDNQKIRFVSMSMQLYGGEEAKQIVKELEAQGVWVFYSGCPEDNQRGYLEKINPNGDPNDFDNYQIHSGMENMLYVNSGDRTVPDSASPTAYRHDCRASQSWSIPVIAGYYILACQADPSMTKEKFMELANKTAQVKESTKPIWVGESDNSVQVGRTNETVPIKIIDIKALLQAIEDEKNKN